MTGSPAVKKNKHWLLGLAERGGILFDSEAVPAGSTSTIWAFLRGDDASIDGRLVRAVSAHYHLGVADIHVSDARTTSLIPEALARKHGVFPLREDDREIIVATCDPTDFNAEQDLGFASGRVVKFEVASPTDIQEAIDTRYSPDRLVENILKKVDAKYSSSVKLVDDEDAEFVEEEEIDSEPVIKLTSVILSDAILRNASDIHVEPGTNAGTVRFRVDGVLHEYMQMPMAALNRIVSRLKILAKLDIADRIRPQDGRARIQVHGVTYDLRLSTVPTRESEKAVIRIMEPEGSRTFEDLGMPGPEMARAKELLSHRTGIVVVTGPTGSGKTTTLYSAIQEIATGELNVMTVEDPIENEITGVTQIQVEPKRNVTFASALRAILRQDPDVIFIGEIRDAETAEIAVQASLTGHLVLATLHTNDAVGVMTRLRDLGLDQGDVAASLRGAIAQRLIRRVCDSCAEQIDELNDEERTLYEKHGLNPKIRAAGCEDCGGTGYRGRVPVVEVLKVDEALEEGITRGAPIHELRVLATNGGMRPMVDVGYDFVERGLTTLQELERIFGETAERRSTVSMKAITLDPLALVVDDDPVNRRIARRLLEKEGFQVEEACDGDEGLQMINDGAKPDIVILDLDMPRLGGREVLEQLRDNPSTLALPVIVATGSSMPQNEAGVIDGGADDYIRKPLDPGRFRARVKAVLRRSQMGR